MRTLLVAAVAVAGCMSSSPPTVQGGTGGDDGGKSDGDNPAPDAGTPLQGDAAVGSDPSSAEIWHPASGTTWQWQLTGTIDTTVDAQVYDIDLFDAPQAVIDTLHAAGRKVICYYSAGTYEDWRADASQFPGAAIGSGVDGWAGENWLDTRDGTVRSIMETRMDLAATKHCDGVEPDNVDGYENDPGFPLTAATQLDYDTFLATQAHARGLSVGLKNDVDQAAQLEPSFDWALNEECSKYDECDTLSKFVAADKAVFHCEYTKTCPAAVAGFSTILKSLDLDAPRTVCN